MPHTNKWNRLLKCLDDVYGFKDRNTSEFNKVGQRYDEERNQHVITIEYKVQMSGGDQVKNYMDPEDEAQRKVLNRIRSMRTTGQRNGV